MCKTHTVGYLYSGLEATNVHSSYLISDSVKFIMLGRLSHYAFDAVLISAFLAGVKRSTGLTPSLNSDKITDNKDFKNWIDKYLGVGEWVMDQSVAVMGSSSWFERRR
ncbi:hypothetical protein EYZ11_011561 [Aspergillus tanneri]|uniref:DUF1748-domain-containing protein n=1 Tax=Aspergillus tanneri TaxID=1220188 RepID=A0A4V3UMX4_9EURO|nr:hypothetical protein EYZ11_011561 [Aspergillus tanneri]